MGADLDKDASLAKPLGGKASGRGMKTVLMLNQFGQVGGGERLLGDVADHLRLRWNVAAMLPSGPFYDRLKSAGVRTTPLRLPSLRAGKKGIGDFIRYGLAIPALARQVRKQMDSASPDLVYVNAPRLLWPALLANRGRNLPIVCAVHLIFGGREQRLLDRWLRHPHVARVTFCSAAAAAAFPDLPRSEVLYNWVSHEFLSPAVPMPVSGPIGVLGRLSRNKGQRLLIEAACPILTDDWSLEIAGGTDFENSAELELLQSMTSDRIKLVEKVDALSFYDSLRVAVVPTTGSEAFGLTAIEAMARERPVIVTRVGGLPEIVEDGVSGLICEPNVGSLREALARLLSDPELRVELGQQGRARVQSAFHPGVQLPKVEAILTESASNRRN